MARILYICGIKLYMYFENLKYLRTATSRNHNVQNMFLDKNVVVNSSADILFATLPHYSTVPCDKLFKFENKFLNFRPALLHCLAFHY